MDIPDKLTFGVGEAADLLGMHRSTLRKMTEPAEPGEAPQLVEGRDWFDGPGARRPERRITRGCLVRLSGDGVKTETAGAQ